MDIIGLRLGRGLSIEDVAKISAMPKALIESWEAGTAYPDLIQAKKLSLTYRCSALKILTAFVGKSNSNNPELAIIPTRRDRLEAERVNQMRLTAKDAVRDSKPPIKLYQSPAEKAAMERARVEIEAKAVAVAKATAKALAEAEAVAKAVVEAEALAKREAMAQNISRILAGEMSITSLGAEDAQQIQKIFGKM